MDENDIIFPVIIHNFDYKFRIDMLRKVRTVQWRHLQYP